MKRTRSFWIVSLAFALIAASWVAWPMVSTNAHARQAEEEEGERSEDEADVDAETLERQLDKIQELLERAEQAGDEGRIRELREQGERLLDRLERLERSREDEGEERFDEEAEEWAAHRRELEIHRLQLEIDRLHVEMNSIQQESAVRLAEIAKSRDHSVSYAVAQAVESLDEGEAHDFLERMLEEVNDVVTIRIIQHRLAQLNFHLDRPDEAIEQLERLILKQ